MTKIGIREVANSLAAAKEIKSVKDARHTIDALLKIIVDAVKEGKQVTFQGFGSFKVVERPERQARNPLNGETFLSPAKKFMRFKPSKSVI